MHLLPSKAFRQSAIAWIWGRTVRLISILDKELHAVLDGMVLGWYLVTSNISMASGVENDIAIGS
jgi:hypothetical protein